MNPALANEAAKLIKQMVTKIIGFQQGGNLGRLYDQLNKADLKVVTENSNIVLLNFDGGNREFDASSPLNVEARVNDASGNPLHAIVYLDQRGDLLAIEVFPWDEWNGGIDIDSLKPASYDDQGLSNP
jgi:hypothetical protein